VYAKVGRASEFARWIILDCGDPAQKFENWQEMMEWIRENFGKDKK